MSMEQLISVFDAKRDPDMEWHDGPSLQEVDSATFGAALVSVRDTCADNS